MRITVAGFGNVLRGDDAFGVRVAEELESGPVPDGVAVFQVGIGGIHLVQELMSGTDALVILDAVDVGRPPGTVVVLDPPIVDVRSWPPERRRDVLADMHYATPERAMMLATALEVLPPVVHIVGCQHQDASTPGIGMTDHVEAAVPVGAAEVRRLVTELGVPWALASELG
jgi:hydrogenase maturation protease